MPGGSAVEMHMALALYRALRGTNYGGTFLKAGETAWFDPEVDGDLPFYFEAVDPANQENVTEPASDYEQNMLPPTDEYGPLSPNDSVSVGPMEDGEPLDDMKEHLGVATASEVMNTLAANLEALDRILDVASPDPPDPEDPEAIAAVLENAATEVERIKVADTAAGAFLNATWEDDEVTAGSGGTITASGTVTDPGVVSVIASEDAFPEGSFVAGDVTLRVGTGAVTPFLTFNAANAVREALIEALGGTAVTGLTDVLGAGETITAAGTGAPGDGEVQITDGGATKTLKFKVGTNELSFVLADAVVEDLITALGGTP